AGRGQVEGGRASQPPGAHDQDAGLADPGLADAADFPQDQVAGIALQFVIVEHGDSIGPNVRFVAPVARRYCVREGRRGPTPRQPYEVRGARSRYRVISSTYRAAWGAA